MHSGAFFVPKGKDVKVHVCQTGATRPNYLKLVSNVPPDFLDTEKAFLSLSKQKFKPRPLPMTQLTEDEQAEYQETLMSNTMN